MKSCKTLAALFAASAAFAGIAVPAGAAPPDKCSKNAENFQIVNGECVSDGKAEKLNDRR